MVTKVANETLLNLIKKECQMCKIFHTAGLDIDGLKLVGFRIEKNSMSKIGGRWLSGLILHPVSHSA